VANDLTGAALAAARSGAAAPGSWRAVRMLVQVLALAALVLMLRPPAAAALDEWRASRQFPVLIEFRYPNEVNRLALNPRLTLVEQGLRIRFGTEHYSGFTLRYFPRDWRGWGYLELAFDNPGHGELSLTCRIHDVHHDNDYHDRYNDTFRIAPGYQVLRLPLARVASAPTNRRMDMEHIAAVGCFTIDLDRPRELILRRIALGPGG